MTKPIDCLKKVRDQRRMVERNGIGIGPLQAVSLQRFAESIEANHVIRSQRVPGDCQLESKRQQAAQENPNFAADRISWITRRLGESGWCRAIGSESLRHGHKRIRKEEAFELASSMPLSGGENFH